MSEADGAPLALPWSDDCEKRKIGEGGVSFDHLGPMIINTDGTVSRIANWVNMTEREREVTTLLLSIHIRWLGDA
jgi:hypothetical protein